MSYEVYYCTNDLCDELTTVQRWPATRMEPADSTWGDGCKSCGDPLQDEPIEDEGPDEPDYDQDRELGVERAGYITWKNDG